MDTDARKLEKWNQVFTRMMAFKLTEKLVCISRGIVEDHNLSALIADGQKLAGGIKFNSSDNVF